MQKTNFKFEAIVHDDCSTDNSASIIKEYAEKYPDIIKPIYEEENQYSKGALFTMITPYLIGKYVAYCEGDDYWTDPNKLQIQVDFLETHPDYVLTCHRYKRFDYEENKWGESPLLKKNGKVISPNEIGVTFDYEENNKMWFTTPLTLVYRNEAREDYNKYKGLIRDYVLIYFLMKHGSGYCFNRKMGVYRLHNGGIYSKQSARTHAIDDYKITKDLYEYDKQNIIVRNNYRQRYAEMLDNVSLLFFFKEIPSWWKFNLLLRTIHGKIHNKKFF
jgi:glycosyltransferase involved in cell wall biosynthesis